MFHFERQDCDSVNYNNFIHFDFFSFNKFYKMTLSLMVLVCILAVIVKANVSFVDFYILDFIENKINQNKIIFFIKSCLITIGLSVEDFKLSVQHNMFKFAQSFILYL